jgi:hypothetical protein
MLRPCQVIEGIAQGVIEHDHSLNRRQGVDREADCGDRPTHLIGPVAQMATLLGWRL